jgi:hypothetical protein
MSWQATKWANEQALPDAETKLLFLILSNYAGHDHTCWPSVKTLSEDCILSERTIQYKLGLLKEMGLIKISKRNTPDGDQTSNLYTVMAPPRCTPCTPPGAPDAPPPRTTCTTPGARLAPKPVSTEPVTEPIKRVRFAPPSEDEVKLAGAKIGLPEIECLKFMSYYGANGWKTGGNPMKSWACALSGWKYRWQERGGGRGGNGSASTPPGIQLRALEALLDRHPANSDSVYHKPDCGSEAVAEYRAMKKKFFELQNQIGKQGMA